MRYSGLNKRTWALRESFYYMYVCTEFNCIEINTRLHAFLRPVNLPKRVLRCILLTIHLNFIIAAVQMHHKSCRRDVTDSTIHRFNTFLTNTKRFSSFSVTYSLQGELSCVNINSSFQLIQAWVRTFVCFMCLCCLVVYVVVYVEFVASIYAFKSI